MDVCEDGVCSVYVWWWLNVRESSLGVCSELCPVCFPIVRECVSVSIVGYFRLNKNNLSFFIYHLLVSGLSMGFNCYGIV